MDLAQQRIFSILFAAGEPLEAARVAQAAGLDEAAVDKYLPALRESLEEAGVPLQLLRLDGKLQLATLPQFAPAIREALELRRGSPLSQAAMEVLAVVAYNQPVTRAFVEQVRGVDSAGVLSALVEKQLVEEAGRLELPGRPIAYRTTDRFLRSFGLESLEDLPALPAEPEELPDDGQLEGQLGFAQLEGRQDG